MRVLTTACVVAVGLAATTLHAAELLPAKLSTYLDPVYSSFDPITSFANKFETSVPIVDNKFSGRFSGFLFDTAVSETSSALDFDAESVWRRWAGRWSSHDILVILRP
jgi:hypothetical protein